MPVRASHARARERICGWVFMDFMDCMECYSSGRAAITIEPANEASILYDEGGAVAEGTRTALTRENGRVLVYSRESTHGSPARRLAEGIGLLSENRKEEGLLLTRTVADNMTITRYGPLSRLGLIGVRILP